MRWTSEPDYFHVYMLMLKCIDLPNYNTMSLNSNERRFLFFAPPAENARVEFWIPLIARDLRKNSFAIAGILSLAFRILTRQR